MFISYSIQINIINIHLKKKNVTGSFLTRTPYVYIQNARSLRAYANQPATGNRITHVLRMKVNRHLTSEEVTCGSHVGFPAIKIVSVTGVRYQSTLPTWVSNCPIRWSKSTRKCFLPWGRKQTRAPWPGTKAYCLH